MPYMRGMRGLGLAIEVVLTPAIGAIAGIFLDRHFMIFPWGMIGGLCAGGLISAKRLWDVMKEMNKNE